MSLSLLTLLFLSLLLCARQVLEVTAAMSETVVQHFRAAVNALRVQQLSDTGIANWWPGSLIACATCSVGGPSDDNQLPVNGLTRCAVVGACRFVPWCSPGQRQSF